MAALLVENQSYGMQGGEGLDELLSSWARSPSSRVLRPEDGETVPASMSGGSGRAWWARASRGATVTASVRASGRGGCRRWRPGGQLLGAMRAFKAPSSRRCTNQKNAAHPPAPPPVLPPVLARAYPQCRRPCCFLPPADGLGPTPEPDALGDFSLDELLMAPSPMGGKAGGDAAGLPRAAAAAALQQQQQQQRQQQGGGGDLPPYLVLPNVSGGLANGGMPLELPPFMGGTHQPNGGSPYLHPPALGGLPPVGSVLSNMAAASSQQPSLSEGGDGQTAKKRRGPRPRLFKKHACQCDGCPVDLAPLSFYLQRCELGWTARLHSCAPVVPCCCLLRWARRCSDAGRGAAPAPNTC